MMNSAQAKIPSPHPVFALSEIPRMMVEASLLWGAAGLLLHAPRGDGHGVMVMPGFLGSDRYNEPLIKWLCSLGYDAVGWGLGTNMGPGPGVDQGLFESLDRLANRSQGKVSVIGHSLGGVYARESARSAPDWTRQVITLGSPVNHRNTTETPTSKLFKLVNKAVEPDHAELAAVPPVPTTSVFSQTDGVVHWRQSVQYSGHENTENIAVAGSHMGLTLNAAVWWLLADRLAQAQDSWMPFIPPRTHRFLYNNIAV